MAEILEMMEAEGLVVTRQHLERSWETFERRGTLEQPERVRAEAAALAG